MTKVLYFIVITLITGCSLLPSPHRKFPEAPKELLMPMRAFTTIPQDTTDLDVLLTNVAENYGKCYELQHRHELLVKWYNDQKTIFETVKK
jgi:hypothetical protein